MFGLEGEFLKNPTDYRSYAVCIPILWCVMWWGLSAKQKDAPNPSGRLVSFMVYARKLGRGGGGGRRREGRADWGNKGDGRWNRGEWKEERRRGEGKTKGVKGGGKCGGGGGTGEG